MNRILLGVIILFGLPTTFAAASEGDAAQGAQVYQACIACHALEPGLHLSGPSLGNIWNRAAGGAEGYVRYSPGLNEAGFEWNAASLDGWLKNPAEMIPGNYMGFQGIDDVGQRADLIAFLEIVGTMGGGERSVADGLMPATYLRAQAPQPLRDAPSFARISSIRHCGDSYFISTEDGQETPFWEKNVRLKIDSVNSGPPSGIGVLLGSGMGGDRISVIFSSIADLTSLVQEKC